jgi:serine/threonine-protein kinase RsbW
MKESANQLKIPSSLKNMNKVLGFVEGVCDTYHINEKYFGNIQVAIEEAVTNAIVHGNKGNVKKHVSISFQRVPFGIMFTIGDQGDGFDFNNVPDPLESNESVETLMGKGIFLIRSLADHVDFRENGSVVELVFNTAGINEETTISRINQLHSYFQTQKTLA